MDIIEWDGTTIKEAGVYKGIPLEEYHHNTKLLPGPSVSKSSLKHIAPPDGCPKKFWQNWAHNPNRIPFKGSDALDFGKAVHAVLLGDEVFEDKFVVMPDTVDGETYHGAKTVWKRWFKAQEQLGLTVISQDQIEQIRRMSADASMHPLVQAGGLNGEVELSYFWQDPETRIWLKARPDVMPSEGTYVDPKTAASLDSTFLSRQINDAGYYLQGALTRKICAGLDMPFESFSFFYLLSKDYGDSDFRVLSNDDLDLGDVVIDYGLKQIRKGLDTGHWPGMAETYTRENSPIRMTDFPRGRITDFLKREGFL